MADGDMTERECLARRIEHSTRGLIHDVNVQAADGKLVVHGYSNSTHLREVAMLTLVAVQAVAPGGRIDVQVERG